MLRPTMDRTLGSGQGDDFAARGRWFSPGDLQTIANVVRDSYEQGRTAISVRVCIALDWRQPNGRVKDMACREVLRKLEESGLVALPPPRTNGANWAAPSLRATEDDVLSISSVDLPALELRLAQSRDEIDEWRRLVITYHYLASCRIVGRQLRYLVYAGDRPIACLGWGDASWAIRARDTWIGWTAEERERNRHLVVNNVRFLILPWVRVANLASHLLGRCALIAADDWQRTYGFRPVLLETFVDPRLFHGTCYRAANWIELGRTAGFAKVGCTHHNSQHPKALFVYPLRKDCTRVLKGECG